MVKNIDKMPLFFEKLPNEAKSLIRSSLKIKEYQKDDIIHQNHQDCSGLIIIENGVIRAYINSETGKEITLYKLYENDICLFSASCALQNIGFSIHISCETDTKVAIIPIDTFNILNNEFKGFSDYVNKILSERFSDIMWLLEQVVFENMEKRLASYLLEETDESNILKVTHEKIANDLGTAREVISRLLKHFERDELLVLKRNSIQIINEEKLFKLL